MKSVEVIMKKLFVILIIFLHYSFLFTQDFQWDEPVKISNNPEGWCILPSICEDSYGNLYVSFSHSNFKENNHLYFTWFDGENWQGIDTLFREQNHDVYSSKMIIDSESKLHMSIEIASGEFGRLYYIYKVNNTWSDILQISVDSLGSTADHDMVIDTDGIIYIFFNANDIYYRTLEDAELSDPINVTNLDLDLFKAFEPNVVKSTDNSLLLSYILRDSNSDIMKVYFKEFSESKWSDSINISKFSDYQSRDNDLAIDLENNPHVVWTQQQTKLDTVLGIPTMVAYYSIYYTKKYNGQWTDPINISNIQKSSSYTPNIEFYGNNPLVFYKTVFENDDIKQYHYSYLQDSEWLINPLDVDISGTSSFDFIVSSLDTIHMVSRSSMINNWADIKYIRGYNNITSMETYDSNCPGIEYLKLYPNPFNNTTKIQFFLDKPDQIDLLIFDITGKLVKTILSNQQLNSGLHLYNWNATNNQRKEVASGIYFLVFLHNSEIIVTRKLILFK